MAKFYGKVGYATYTEGQNGVWKPSFVERYLYGDVVKNTRQLFSGEDVNSDITTSNSISVLADPYALDNFFAIRYVEWMGRLWFVTNVEVQAPRLLLRLGGVYNGRTPSAPANPGGGTG